MPQPRDTWSPFQSGHTPVIWAERYKEHSGESRDGKGKRLEDFGSPGMKLKFPYIGIETAASKEIAQSEILS